MTATVLPMWPHTLPHASRNEREAGPWGNVWMPPKFRKECTLRRSELGSLSRSGSLQGQLIFLSRGRVSSNGGASSSSSFRDVTLAAGRSPLGASERSIGRSDFEKSAADSPVEDTSSAPVSSRI